MGHFGRHMLVFLGLRLDHRCRQELIYRFGAREYLRRSNHRTDRRALLHCSAHPRQNQVRRVQTSLEDLPIESIERHFRKLCAFHPRKGSRGRSRNYSLRRWGCGWDMRSLQGRVSREIG